MQVSGQIAHEEICKINSQHIHLYLYVDDQLDSVWAHGSTFYRQKSYKRY